ncbi:MAG: DUF4349 domain-containing protein [Chloroflexi bacterium]|nr:DUF4349 domain-containing protein [Chloroflexota bacterium]
MSLARPLRLSALGLLLLAAACAPAAEFSGVGPPAGQPMPGGTESKITPAETPSLPDRLVIRNGQIDLVVTDMDGAVKAVTSLPEEIGGFVVSAVRSGQAESAYAYITIRVPAEKFTLVLQRLRALAQRVESEQIDSQDVTEEHVDLQARLRNLQATEAQYVALLERANTVEDVLKVQRELSTTRGEIERFQGRITFLEQSAALSLITVTLRPVASPAPLVNPRWDPLETVKEAVRDEVVALQGLATLGIQAAVFAPLWLPPVLLFVWALRRWRVGQARPTPQPPGQGAA